VDRKHARVRIPRGVRLDLGCSAKAWAADRSAAAAAAAAGCGALVAVGGDVATSGPAPGRGWLVHVTDDHRSAPSAPGQTVRIRDGGLATSSTAVRRWLQAGQEMHHIIDPRTGRPARSEWRTVSVAAADCTQANIAASAAIVRGHSAPAWLQELGLPARLVEHSGRVHSLAGWPAPGNAAGAAMTVFGSARPAGKAA
jgi:thiamine biosynthesis lipoprotein